MLRKFAIPMAVGVGAALTVFAMPAQSMEKKMAVADARLLAAGCFNCHGPAGESQGHIDEINDISADKMVKKMKEFREGKASTIMGRIAKGFSDAELMALAAHIEALNK